MANETPRAPSVDDAIAAIRAYVRARDWSLWRLAKEAGLSDTSLRHFHKPEWCPTAVTLRILYALIPKDFDPASVPPCILDEEEWHDDRKRRRQRAGSGDGV